MYKLNNVPIGYSGNVTVHSMPQQLKLQQILQPIFGTSQRPNFITLEVPYSRPEMLIAVLIGFTTLGDQLSK